MILTIIIVVAALVGLWLGIRWLLGFTLIGSQDVGLVEKRFSRKGSLDKAIIALNGEAGYQPDVLRGGIHFRGRIQYRLHKVPLVTIPQGEIGYVFARDGEPLRPEQTLGKVIPGNSFEDVRFFLTHGGQRGPQRAILREGTYAINLLQFVVLTLNRTYYMKIENDDKTTIEQMGQALRSIDGFRPVRVGGVQRSAAGDGFSQTAQAVSRAVQQRGSGAVPDAAAEMATEIAGDVVGIVTVHDGPSLPQGEIIAPPVGNDPAAPQNYHNNFQDPEKFLAAGGLRGKQYHVLTDGTYFINRLFATVEFIPKTAIEIGWTGVVVSFFGEKGIDSSGEDFRHGELVEVGHKGVWQDPLMPGKYAFNTYAGRVEKVPVTNFVLKWIHGEAGPHGFDQNLSEISLITKDAFEPTLPLSVVIQIPYREAPLVIQRFGNIQRLVEQTLDPMVGSYFKNIGQRMTLIELIQHRSEIQDQSTEQMREKFARYNLRLEEVLIGTPSAPASDIKIEQILSQLRDRQIADEQVVTYQRQQSAAEQEKMLNEARAVAAQQTGLTESAIAISIQENAGKAEAVKAIQEAQKITTLAGADARRIKLTAEAQGGAEAQIGIGKAIAVSEQVKAYGGPSFQVAQDVMSRIAQAIETSHVPIVPSTVISMGGGDGDAAGGGASAFGNLLTLLLTLTSSEKLGVDLGHATTPEQDKIMQGLKDDLLRKISQPEPAIETVTENVAVNVAVTPKPVTDAAKAAGMAAGATPRTAATAGAPGGAGAAVPAAPAPAPAKPAASPTTTTGSVAGEVKKAADQAAGAAQSVSKAAGEVEKATDGAAKAAGDVAKAIAEATQKVRKPEQK